MRRYPNPPESVSPDDLPEPDCTPEGVPIPAFIPWQPRRTRSGGWSPETQRAFIHELTRIGSVGAAARVVGKTARSAYQLRDKDGAESFAAAWETARFAGWDHARAIAIERALYGEMVPTFRAGRFTGYKLLYNDSILVAALNASRTEADEQAALESWRRRLEKWEIALRRQAMDLDDMLPARRAAEDNAWQDHIVWKREMKAEARRQRNIEIRAAVRKGMARRAPPAPRITLL